MNLRVRIISIILVACALAGTFVYARSDRSVFEDYSLFNRNKTTVRLWYTDDALTPYLQSKAVAYSESNSKVRVEPVLVSGLEYLEAVGTASIEEDSFPDLFIISNDSLEKAYLAGLATEIEDGDVYLSDSIFPAAAIDSITYKGKKIGYPLYFETSSLIYNKTYLENMAQENLQSEIDQAEGEAAQAEIDQQEAELEEEITEPVEDTTAEITQGMIDEVVADTLPLNISDILKFAENYNAPEQVEAVFKWDVTDIFYNYFFVGNYMDVGGRAGDDVSLSDIYNTDTISCMKIYQQLNQFFAIDEEQVNYEKVVQDFIDGKTVFTVATSDVVSKIEQAKTEGNCNFEYGVATMPALNDTYLTRTMSVTDCLVINGYSEHEKEANSFARFLCSEDTDSMYTMCGKLLARSGVAYENESLSAFSDVYGNSVPMPKLMATSNFWVQLEIAFANIWDGENVNDTLRQLSENVKLQIGGEEVHEEVLPDATVKITEAEEN